MGRHTKSKIVKMKLFAVLALAVAGRQVNQFGTNLIDADCTKDGDCGDNTECKAPADSLMRAGEKCSCLADFVASADNINCEAAEPDVEVIVNLDTVCTEADTCGANAAPGDVCVVEDKNCGGNQECKATDGEETKLTCQCEATHEPKEGKCEPLTTDGSAAFYSVATAFMALILA